MADEVTRIRSHPYPQPQKLRVSLGIEDGKVRFVFGALKLTLTADQADQLSADLRMYALELRNGGKVV